MVRGSRRSWVSTRAATAKVIRGASCRRLVSTSARNAVSTSSAPACCLIAAGVSVGQDRALAHQQQPVAALGLVHDVAGHEDGGAAVGELVEQLPQVAAQHRVEADGRLVEHQQVGLPSSATARLARERWPPLSRPTTRVGVRRRGRPRRSPRSTSASRTAEHAGEEAQVLGDGEVVVHAGGLGDVADPVPQRRAAGRLAEDHAPRRRSPAARRRSTRISVDLPQPLGPSRPVTRRRRSRGPARWSTGRPPRTTVRPRTSTALFTM